MITRSPDISIHLHHLPRPYFHLPIHHLPHIHPIGKMCHIHIVLPVVDALCMYRTTGDIIDHDLPMLWYILTEGDEQIILHRIREKRDVCWSDCDIVTTACTYRDGPARRVAAVFIAHGETHIICA